MAKPEVIDERHNGSLRNLTNSIIIKAEVIGGISTNSKIVIDVRANISGGIEAPQAEVYVKGRLFSIVGIRGGIDAHKVNIQHGEINGHITANEVNIKHGEINGHITANKVEIKHAEINGPINADTIKISSAIVDGPVKAENKFL